MTEQNNARLIAELQAVTLAVRMFGLERLPETLTLNATPPAAGNGAEGGINKGPDQ